MNKINPLELVGCGALIIDSNKEIVYYNEAATRILKIKKSQAIGRSMQDILNSFADSSDKESTSILEQLLYDIDCVLSKNHGNNAFQDTIKWKDSWLVLELDGFRSEEGMRCLISITDITDYQKEIIRLSEKNIELEKDLKRSTISDAWIRKTVLLSLFLSVGVFVLVSVGVEMVTDVELRTLDTIVTGFMSMLSLAIGFYFNNDTRRNTEHNIEGFYPVQNSIFERNLDLPEDRILDIE